MPRNELKHGSGALGALGGKSCITVASIINDGETKYCIYLFIKRAAKAQGRRERERRRKIMKYRRNEWMQVSLLNG